VGVWGGGYGFFWDVWGGFLLGGLGGGGGVLGVWGVFLGWGVVGGGEIVRLTRPPDKTTHHVPREHVTFISLEPPRREPRPAPDRPLSGRFPELAIKNPFPTGLLVMLLLIPMLHMGADPPPESL